MTKKLDTPENLKVLTRFDELISSAKIEGAIGVEDEKLIHRTIRRPHVYRKSIRDRLIEIDETYTPLTYQLFTEIYTYATVA